MHAIRCRISGKTFRRDGMEFSGNAWTFVEQASERQLEEPMLLCVEVESEADPSLEEALKPVAIVAEDLPQTPEAELRGLLISLQAENGDLREIRDILLGKEDLLKAELAEVHRQLSAAQATVEAQGEQIRLLEQTNAELGQEYTRLLREAQAAPSDVPINSEAPQTLAESVPEPSPAAPKEGKAAKSSASPA